MRSRNLSLSTSLLAALAGGAVCLPHAARAAGTQAGATITDTATATFSGPGGDETINSNAVVLKVDEVLDVTVISGQSGDLPSTPGATNQVLKFQLTNGGNGTEAFSLVATPAAGGAFTPSVTGIALDTDGNGAYDPGIDTAYTSGGNDPALLPDQSLNVFVLPSIPAGTADGARGGIRLVATSVTGTGQPGTTFSGKGDGGVNAVVGATGADSQDDAFYKVAAAVISLTKSATVADKFGGTSNSPGAIITYSLAAAAAGSGSVANVRVSDEVPAGTAYVPGTITLDGASLTDAADNDPGSFAGNAMSVIVGNVAAGTTKTITFQVKIN